MKEIKHIFFFCNLIVPNIYWCSSTWLIIRMIFITWQPIGGLVFLIICFTVLTIILDLVLFYLFTKKIITRKVLIIRNLIYFSLMSLIAHSLFLLITIIHFESPYLDILKYTTNFCVFFSPLFLLRFSNFIFRKKNHIKLEMSFFFSVFFLFLFMKIVYDERIMYYFIYFILFLMLCYVAKNLIIQTIIDKNLASHQDPLVHTGAKLFVLSGITFFSHNLFLLLFDIFPSGWMLPVAVIIAFLFNIFVYLGYYMPFWFKKIILRNNLKLKTQNPNSLKKEENTNALQRIIEKDIVPQKREIHLCCPKCGHNIFYSIPHEMVELRNQTKKGVINVTIPRGLTCEHTFLAVIDQNFVVRKFELIDFIQ